MTLATPTHPLMRYHGGKWLLGKWITANMPPHRTYVEPFGGAASVLLQKPRVAAEVYNDLEDAVVNVFRCLQSPDLSLQLMRRLRYTTFSRAEFERSYEPVDGVVDFACKTIVRSFYGFGTDSVTRSCRTGFRRKLSGNGTSPAQSWLAWMEDVPAFIERLRGVTIEHIDAFVLIPQFDTPDTLLFCDPPYVLSSRSSLMGRGARCHGYRHELTDQQHRDLATLLHKSRGMVMLCGYQTDLYDELYGDWVCLSRRAFAHEGARRVERLWLNPAAAARRPQAMLMERSAEQERAA